MSLYVLTGPFTNTIGLYRLPLDALAEDLNLPSGTARRRFGTVVPGAGRHYDVATRVVWLPTWIRENSPQIPTW